MLLINASANEAKISGLMRMYGQGMARGILPELHVYTGYLFGPKHFA
jgi:hypothetical protein